MWSMLVWEGIHLTLLVVSDLLGFEECTKESVSIQYVSSVLVIRPSKSCNEVKAITKQN